MKVQVRKVEGLKDLEKLMLETLPAKVARQTTLKAMRESAKPMAEAAKTKVRKQSGALEESIGIKTVPQRMAGRGRKNAYASITVGPRSGVASAWAKYLAHYGRGINLVDKRTGSVTASKIGRIRHGHLVEFGFRHKSGKHVPARPFLRPAFDSAAPQYLSVFKEKLRRKIELAGAKSRNGI